MKHIINAGEKIELNLAPETTEQEIMQNLYVLLNTVKGEVSMYRDFGLDTSETLAAPLPVAETVLTSEIYDAVEKYEPRVKILNIEFETDSLNGKLIPVLEISI